MVLSSSIKVLLSSVYRWLHALQLLSQSPVVTIVVLRSRGVTEHTITEKIQNVGEWKEHYFV